MNLISTLLARVSKWTGARRAHRFDKRYRVETRECLMPDELLGMQVGTRRYSEAYVPTDIGLFRRIVRNAAIDPSAFTFVDLGCGKGRALFLAAERGFSQVVGVEADRDLCQIAAANAERWSRVSGRPPPTIVHGDAADAILPAGDLFIFMFNPFNGDTFDRVVNRLRDIADEERAIVIGYHNDVHGGVLERSGAFERVRLRPRRFWARSTVSLFFNSHAKRLRKKSRL